MDGNEAAVTWKESRWTLEVEFDSVREMSEAGDDSLFDNPMGEAAHFYGFVRMHWSILEPEDADCLAWEGETVKCTSSTLDHFYDLMQVLTMRYIPKSVKLIRNAER